MVERTPYMTVRKFSEYSGLSEYFIREKCHSKHKNIICVQKSKYSQIYIKVDEFERCMRQNWF